MGVSVALPARDAAATVAGQVAALARQELSEPWELLVVDDASTDGTADVVRRAAAGTGLRLRVLPGGGRGAYAARQLAVGAADGDRLVFCDADDEVGAGWLAAHAAGLRDAALTTGPLELALLNPPAVAAGRDWPADRGAAVGNGFLPYALGANLGIRRDVLAAVGGWPVARRNGGDKVVSWRAQLAGHRLGWLPEAVVHVRLPDGPRATLRRQYRIGAAAPSLYGLFRDAGMPPSPVRAAARDWAWLGVEGARLGAAALAGRGPAIRERQLKWARVTGYRSGRLAASLRGAPRYL